MDRRREMLSRSPSLHAAMATVDADPRSASLDLLRSPTVSPLPARASFESVSTLRGHRISSPIFLNSSIGVRPKQQDDEPQTPRHETSDHLRSKFSMSPLQPSKRSKARVSQDPYVARIEAKSTIGHWSHSLGAAARRLQNTLPRRGDAMATVKTIPETNDVTPDKKALKGAASFASIRRLITPSRRTRKVSAAPRLAVPRAAVLEVEQGPELVPAVAADDAGWIDAEGSTEDGARPRSSGTAELRLATSPSPPGSNCATRPGDRDSKSSSVSDQGGRSVSADALARRAIDYSDQNDKTVIARNDAESMHSVKHEVLEDNFSLVGDGIERDQASKTWSGPPYPAPSKLKTLQLLARRPFHAFGRKMREMDVSWWPRSSQDEVISQQPISQCTAPAFALRRSEDLLSKASPRVYPHANPSRSLDQDRIQLPSKVVPIRSTGAAVYKLRPNIPDAFVRQKPAAEPQPRPLERTTVSAPLLAPRISNNRHPWMKQLQLSNNLAAQVGTITEPSFGQDAAPSVANRTADAKVAVPKLSLTAAEDAVHMPIYGSSQVVNVDLSACRRPPASLLGQSLPIPPRGGRRRASTVSSQSSSVSSPSGKVIVSRRSYGQRSRSPGSREGAGSIRSVGTSILFGETPPGTPGLRRMLSPQTSSGSPSRAAYVRSPSNVVTIPKYSPARHRQEEKGLHRKPSSSFTAESERDEEQEWVDEAPITSKRLDLVALRSKIEAALPATRPGFLEMSEATDTLSYLVKTFNGSSGSLISNSSPFKTGGLADPTSPRDLYGIAEADEINFPRRSACYLGGRSRVRLTSKASLVSTEANSSFEDSEELQKLLDSIMATDLGNSCDTSGSQGDMALLSPFGSPADRLEPCGDAGCASESRSRATPRSSPMPPPPKFLLNDRPISPPDSTNMSECMHTSASDDPGTDPQPPLASRPFESATASLCRTASWSSATSQTKISRASIATLNSQHAQRQSPFTSRL